MKEESIERMWAIYDEEYGITEYFTLYKDGKIKGVSMAQCLELRSLQIDPSSERIGV